MCTLCEVNSGIGTILTMLTSSSPTSLSAMTLLFLPEKVDKSRTGFLAIAALGASVISEGDIDVNNFSFMRSKQQIALLSIEPLPLSIAFRTAYPRIKIHHRLLHP
jgi:hypothetical protein